VRKLFSRGKESRWAAASFRQASFRMFRIVRKLFPRGEKNVESGAAGSCTAAAAASFRMFRFVRKLFPLGEREAGGRLLQSGRLVQNVHVCAQSISTWRTKMCTKIIVFRMLGDLDKHFSDAMA
jgi:hypothetical protein